MDTVSIKADVVPLQSSMCKCRILLAAAVSGQGHSLLVPINFYLTAHVACSWAWAVQYGGLNISASTASSKLRRAPAWARSMRRTGVRARGPATDPISDAGASMPEAVRAKVLLGVKALKLLRPGPDDRDCLVPWLCSKSVLQQCEASMFAAS